MNGFRFILFSFFVFTFSCKTLNVPFEGNWTGLSRINQIITEDGAVHFFMENARPNQEWYHEVKLQIKQDSIFITKRPVVFIDNVKQNRTEGGFYTYKGKLVKSGTQYISDLQLVKCRYCPDQLLDKQDSIIRDKPQIPEMEEFNMRYDRRIDSMLRRPRVILENSPNGLYVNGVLYQNMNSPNP